jgi:hypothetical protein
MRKAKLSRKYSADIPGGNGERKVKVGKENRARVSNSTTLTQDDINRISQVDSDAKCLVDSRGNIKLAIYYEKPTK